jgi:lipoate-protein ligase A
MPAEWRLLVTPPAHGAWNMAADEAILARIGRGQAPATLRLYAWDPPCLSLGSAQHYSDVDVTRLQHRGWEVVRRATGGRAILHTDELTYSVIAATSEPAVSGSLLESYNRLAAALLRAAHVLGLAAEMKGSQRPAPHSANPVCFEAPSAYEITVGGRKLIGSAQARRKEGVLQHGSLPLAGDLTRITEVLVYPDNAQRSAAAKRLLEHATTAESVLGRAVDWASAADAFASAFESELGIHFTRSALEQDEAAMAEELVRVKYGHSSWTERA